MFGKSVLVIRPTVVRDETGGDPSPYGVGEGRNICTMLLTNLQTKAVSAMCEDVLNSSMFVKPATGFSVYDAPKDNTATVQVPV